MKPLTRSQRNCTPASVKLLVYEGKEVAYETALTGAEYRQVSTVEGVIATYRAELARVVDIVDTQARQLSCLPRYAVLVSTSHKGTKKTIFTHQKLRELLAAP